MSSSYRTRKLELTQRPFLGRLRGTLELSGNTTGRRCHPRVHRYHGVSDVSEMYIGERAWCFNASVGRYRLFVFSASDADGQAAFCVRPSVRRGCLASLLSVPRSDALLAPPPRLSIQLFEPGMRFAEEIGDSPDGEAHLDPFVIRPGQLGGALGPTDRAKKGDNDGRGEVPKLGNSPVGRLGAVLQIYVAFAAWRDQLS